MAKKYFPRQELAARGLSPMAIAALERGYQLSESQVTEIEELADRISAQETAPASASAADFSALEEGIQRLAGLTAPGPTHADVSALQSQIDDLKLLVFSPGVCPEPEQDLMYPPSYN